MAEQLDKLSGSLKQSISEIYYTPVKWIRTGSSCI